MNKKNIKNWKILEYINNVEIIDNDSYNFFKKIVKTQKLPLTNNKTINRKNTSIDWQRMPKYYSFFFDTEGEEKKNEIALRNSELSSKKRVIILFDKQEPAITIATDIFIKEWEDFIASTQWETLIISDDFELIIEISRDYFMHSNFKIK